MGSKDPAEENALQIIGHWYSCRLDRAYTPREETAMRVMIDRITQDADYFDSREELIDHLGDLFSKKQMLERSKKMFKDQYYGGKRIINLLEESLSRGKISRALFEERFYLFSDSLKKMISFVDLAKTQYYSSGDLTQEDMDIIFLEEFGSPEEFAECQKNIRIGGHLMSDSFHLLDTENDSPAQKDVRNKLLDRYNQFELALSHRIFHDLESRVK